MTFKERREQRQRDIERVREIRPAVADEMERNPISRMRESDCYCGCDASDEVNDMQDEIDELRSQLRALSERFVHLQESVATAGMLSTRTIPMGLVATDITA